MSRAAGYDTAMNDDRTADDRDDGVPAHHDGILAADTTGLVAQQEYLTIVTESEPELATDDES